MQLASKAKKFFYAGCLILLLSKLGDVTRPQAGFYWQRSTQTLTKLLKSWQSQKRAILPEADVLVSMHGTQPLVMGGGDPYVRALMRTITASEANVTHPYNVVYG
ncbi:MAG: glycoside hydrolase, partial [Waterburya sp.]